MAVASSDRKFCFLIKVWLNKQQFTSTLLYMYFHIASNHTRIKCRPCYLLNNHVLYDSASRGTFYSIRTSSNTN